MFIKRIKDPLFNGIGLGEEELAIDIIKKVGPGGSFIKEKHTRKHYRKTLWFPPLGRRMPLDSWIKLGKPSYVKEAFKTAKLILEETFIPELPKDIDKDLFKVVKEAEKREVSKK